MNTMTKAQAKDGLIKALEENAKLRAQSKRFAEFILSLGLIEDLNNPDNWEDEDEYYHAAAVAALAREALK